MKKIELLAPAGTLEKLKMAIHYGADAVYAGGKEFSLRAAAGNLSLSEMSEGIAFAHKHKAKVYTTINIFANNKDLSKLPEYIKNIEDIGADAIIISDPGVLWIAKKLNIKIPIHLSTQANTMNWAAVKFWEHQNVSRINLARELSLEEIKEIREKSTLDIEMFVHGAMCISLSGRCLLSNYMTERDANRGECAQPCRWNYALTEEKRPGEYFPLEEDTRGSYIFNSQDLCLIRYLPLLIEAGINSIKIEGRMKSIHYVSTIVHTYRQALDAYYKDPQKFVVEEKWLEEISKVSHRNYTNGFIFGKPGPEALNYFDANYVRRYDFIGVVLDYDEKSGLAKIEQRNNFKRGQTAELFGPTTKRFDQKINYMLNEANDPIDEAPHPCQIVRIKMDKPVKKWDMLRRLKNE